MSELPKIAKRQIASGVAGAHPDANLLTAFVEEALGERERAGVLSHLASCSECREVVSLAMPEIAEAEPARAARILFLHLPVWRFVTVAAMIAIVAGGVIWRIQKDHNIVATREQTAAPAEKPTEQAREADALQPKTEPKLQAKLDEKRSVIAASPAKPARQKRDEDTFARALPATPERADTQIAQANKPATAGGLVSSSAAPAPVAKDKSERVYAYSTNETVNAQNSSDVASTDTQTQAKTGTPVPAVGETLGAKGKQPAKEETAGKQAEISGLRRTEAAPQMDVMNKKLLVTRSPQWRINAMSNNLQRSFDAGQNWADVTLGAPVRAYAAVGPHIWAAGDKGKLYHSTDFGATWNRVAVGTLGDDIRAIRFKDAQHGEVTSARQEIWATSDGGQTWSKK